MFFRRKRIEREDRIWATTALKWKGICDQILKEANGDANLLTFAHFEETLEELKKHLHDRDLKYVELQSTEEISMSNLEKLRQGGTRTVILPSEAVSSPEPSESLYGQENPPEGTIQIIVAEHYPLPERDETLLFFATHLPGITRIVFHAALDEPLMKMFGAESVMTMLKKLGWNETEFIAHAAITSAIAAAQKKMTQKATGDLRARSAKEWFYYNCPESISSAQ
jgi:preprotein translocase subunit SecA